jgi:hypothetical protein
LGETRHDVMSKLQISARCDDRRRVLAVLTFLDSN